MQRHPRRPKLFDARLRMYRSRDAWSISLRDWSTPRLSLEEGEKGASDGCERSERGRIYAGRAPNGWLDLMWLGRFSYGRHHELFVGGTHHTPFVSADRWSLLSDLIQPKEFYADSCWDGCQRGERHFVLFEGRESRYFIPAEHVPEVYGTATRTYLRMEILFILEHLTEIWRFCCNFLK